ncbi:uncharacterized protein [Euphorbia lathyris]|uniref:uncharacterized protein n=1 Tax=Euphorbia lathyris TaxID=212925 RepID=UPI003313ECC8
MKLKKGKVYPSSPPPPSPPPPPPSDGDVFSVLKLLPATILTLASILSLEDKEVLAYMITRSLKTTTNPQNPNSSSSTSSASSPQTPKKKSSKKLSNSNPTSKNQIFTNSTHKVPIFDCDCFDCYTSYWFRWDSSPNRELIHQAIEAFEDHLTNGEQSKKQQRGNKRRDKSGRRPVVDVPEMEVSPEIDGGSPEKVADDDAEKNEETVSVVEVVPAVEIEDVVRSPVTVPAPAGVGNHKGLARKVLPDVLGILNSRLWSLWRPNV